MLGSMWNWFKGMVGEDRAAPVPAMRPNDVLRAGGEINHVSGPQEIADAEREYIEAYRANADRAKTEPVVGLALSGGGVRSASIALGVMQGLAARGCLKRFDYLSTVSGGGYIGSSLTWYTSRQWPVGPGDPLKFGVGASEATPFPYGDRTPGSAPPHPRSPSDRLLRYLSQHANYLNPGRGFSILKPGRGANIGAAVAVVLRGVLLNLFIWLSIVTAVMLGLILVGRDQPCTALPFFHGLVCLGLVLLGIFALICLLYSWVTGKARIQQDFSRPAWLDNLFSLGYGMRRFFDIRTPLLLVVAVIAIVIGLLPEIDALLSDKIRNAGLWSILTGAVGGLWSFWQSRQSAKSAPSMLDGIVGPLGAFLILFGVLLGGYHAAYAVACKAAQSPHIIGLFSHAALPTGWLPPFDSAIARAAAPAGTNLDAVAGVVVLLVVALFTGRFVNLNYISIHRYYRDRLMEAFLPDPASALENALAPAEAGDQARLSEMCLPEIARGPYHLINCNVILSNSTVRRRGLRGGDSFLLSPRYCGSSATGWIRTESWFGDTMTLASAMAISGAAANPGAGVGGVGPTRNRLVSLLMSMLSLRLGCWVPNPRLGPAGSIKPNHFRPGFDEMIDWGLSEDFRNLQLSDGGHFDNLGLYELIRRKVRLIVLSDGSADPTFAFGDLQSVLPRLRQDFGAIVEFDGAAAAGSAGIDGILPLLATEGTGRYPDGQPLSGRGYALAHITYADGTTGTLVYLKAAALEAMTLELLGYKGRTPDFPNEPTIDQFYSEDKFNAHRFLGYFLVTQMLDARAGHLPAHPRLAWL